MRDLPKVLVRMQSDPASAIAALDSQNSLRMRQIPSLAAVTLFQPSKHKLRAHSPIAQQRPLFVASVLQTLLDTVRGLSLKPSGRGKLKHTLPMSKLKHALPMSKLEACATNRQAKSMRY